ADGSEVMTGNWPIQVRVPDSVPITRPMLNNPSDTRTPIRIQDFRISSSPALAQLDDDPELEIVVRSQMSDTMPSTDVEVLSGVGHLIAYDHDGTYHVGRRSEEHTSELQSRRDLVCRLLLEKKKTTNVRLHVPLHGISLLLQPRIVMTMDLHYY